MSTPIEESNLAFIGSDQDKAAREKAASLDVNWEGAGKEPGNLIWRVENKRDASGNPDFGIRVWPKDRYGEFYTGDSYIVLHTSKEEGSDALQWDIYFWIGSQSSQDEYGVAAYKANELDDLLGDAPIQHREVQGMESEEFLNLFRHRIRYLDGGIDSGFRHVEVDCNDIPQVPTRLFHMHKSGRVTRCMQVPVSSESLNQGDAFLLDAGSTVYSWFGESASPFEKEKAAEMGHAIMQGRGGHSQMEVDVGMENQDFWKALGGQGPIADASSFTDKDVPAETAPTMYRVREEDSHLKITQVPPVQKSLDSDDVFLLDIGHTVYIWVGKDASKREKSQAMVVVQTHLKNFQREQSTKVSRVLEGQEGRAKGFSGAMS